MIKLVEDTIDSKDIDNLIDWLKTYPRLTKGQITLEFEEKWSNWIGCKHSLFVNSGSSANLIVLAALKYGNLLANNKIVIPSLAWPTDLAPAIQLGFEPILCDINLSNLAINTDMLENIFQEEKPSCLLIVSVLGILPDMDKITSLCKKYDVILVGDHCESFGSEFNHNKLGNCGEFASTFSLFFGHHLSTIEGGMVCTNDTDFYDTLLMVRSHGWTRDLSRDKQIKLQNEWNIDDFNNLYTFYIPGFNLRSTDLQAYIGLGQLDKADEICKNRNKNFNLYNKYIKINELNISTSEDNFISAFAYPFVNKNIKKLVPLLQDKNIDCRPLICGSMGNQPMYKMLYGKKSFDNCDIIDEYGIYLPCHDKLSEEDIIYVSEVINSIQ
jgi:CDP-6-deoxy-D-xylo-4-hexulose-3-dehydrase